ncbi:unnamed protein product [Musa acuminata subsp. malaccensis]|uniref:(wild Malaysian banana) hypothetical protein n=1 Tax=Musa acuminata subsp. malaccensis TaxID=214687 RepID=A0A804L620_MUSAM|nr:PREDICTED: surfeit locus protein 2 [Musa acuminata subsp. malaccensis]CAG1864041.1 unnamed protein product [Musa acuminata subsp. malaccensis]
MGKRGGKVKGGGGEGTVLAQNPTSNEEAEHSNGLSRKKKSKAKDGGGKGNGEKEKVEKEGAFLLGEPTFLDLGNGRLRCVETGHELLAKDREAYGRTKACRLALIDAAVARKKPPLNMFQPHPTSKSQLVCKLTGDAVNKSEEHIWKHVSGKKFQNMLEQKEMESHANAEAVEKNAKQSKKQFKSKKDQKKNAHESDSLTKKTKANSDDIIEPDFWVPPVGSRWDFDDGEDRWDSHENSDDDADGGTGLDGTSEKDDPETRKLAKRSKRTSKSVGLSSFVSRKKKIKKATTSPSEQQL